MARALTEVALDQIHQQEREIVQHVAGCDQRIELDRVERDRLAVDQRDVAEMQIAVAAQDPSGRAAPHEQRCEPIKRRAGCRDQFGRVRARKQIGMRGEVA